MESVWKDINIASLPNTPLPHTDTCPPNPCLSNTTTTTEHIIFHPIPPTSYRGLVLQDFFDSNPHDDQIGPTTALHLTTLNFQPTIESTNNKDSAFGTFDALASSNSVSTTFGGGGCGDDTVVKKSRMIKNRESAARSRARKQAYISELELEVAYLVEENTRLRKLQQMLVAPSTQPPKKHGLHRTLSSPF